MFVYDQADNIIGTIDKSGRGWYYKLKIIFSVTAIADTDNYGIIFPLNASTEERALLLAASMMLDYRYFEFDPNKKPLWQYGL